MSLLSGSKTTLRIFSGAVNVSVPPALLRKSPQVRRRRFPDVVTASTTTGASQGPRRSRVTSS